MSQSPRIKPNTTLNPSCVVDRTTWQALPAMLLVERSGFGLNELLGANQCSEMECDICKAVRQNWEEQAATIEPQPAAGNATDEREQGRHWVKRERSVRIAQPVPDAKGNSGDEHHSQSRS